jgi:6-phospho-beta-glucosidase
VIEVPALVGVNGLRPLPVDPLPADIAGLIGHVAGYERLALDAALYGGRDRVFRAMLAHPLVQQRDRAEKLTDLLLQANGRYLGWAQ